MKLEDIRYLGFNQHNKIIAPWVVYVIKKPETSGTWSSDRGTYLIVWGVGKLRSKVVHETKRALQARINLKVDKGFTQKDNLKLVQEHFPNLFEDLGKIVFWETMKHSA